jgi:hypothetical protein
MHVNRWPAPKKLQRKSGVKRHHNKNALLSRKKTVEQRMVMAMIPETDYNSVGLPRSYLLPPS